MNKTIKLYGFSRNDELVFTSLISLLSNKTPYQWDVVGGASAQVAVIDVDQYPDDDIFDEIKGTADQIVTYGNRQLDAGYPVLTKPLRAASILKCLSLLSEQEDQQANNFELPEQAYAPVETVFRLRRWPAPEILKSTQGSARICAVLLKQPLSVADVVNRVGLSESAVKCFLQLCLEEGLLIQKERSSSIAYTRKDNHPLHPLFSKLRAKFGARG